MFTNPTILELYATARHQGDLRSRPRHIAPPTRSQVSLSDRLHAAMIVAVHYIVRKRRTVHPLDAAPPHPTRPNAEALPAGQRSHPAHG